ncbi:MAG: hypothetical protein AAF467_15140 [Actinomycetota bacterium]
MPVALLHAYRAANRGDRWLVELSRTLVADAAGCDPIIYALDPHGMGPDTRQVLASPTRLRAAFAAGASTVPHLQPVARTVAQLPAPDDLDAVIGIGGGYLRSNDPVHELVFRAHHLPQLQLIAQLGARGAYLPVSVGPFRRGLGRVVRRTLGEVAWVAVRDDRSARYLGGWARTRRAPDLGACWIGRTRPALAPGDPGVAGIALRALRGTSLGVDTIEALTLRGVKTRFGLQSDHGRTNDDRAFYAAAGITDAVGFGELLATEPRPGVMLAGRLHAALEAIAAGIPTIHLGYERKSFGAYADLGLPDHVVDPWTTTADDLADRIEALAADPEPYWAALTDRFGALEQSWNDLGEAVHQLVSRRGPDPVRRPTRSHLP